MRLDTAQLSMKSTILWQGQQHIFTIPLTPNPYPKEKRNKERTKKSKKKIKGNVLDAVVASDCCGILGMATYTQNRQLIHKRKGTVLEI